MFNVRSVLSMAILCSVVGGSVFLEGMNGGDREVKKVNLYLSNNFYEFAYPDITKDPTCINYSLSLKSLPKRYGYSILPNDPMAIFCVEPSLKVCGKEAMKGFCRKFTFMLTVAIPIKLLLNKDGTLKNEGDTITIKMFEEKFDVMGTFKKGRFDCASTLHQALCDRIETTEKYPNYCITGGNKEALLEQEILFKDSDGKIRHGKNGFDFSRIKVYSD